MAAVAALMEPSYDVDKLSYKIFSILESKFLFGYAASPSVSVSARGSPSPPEAIVKAAPLCGAAGKVRILSIDGNGRASDVLLAGATLANLEASLRRLSGDPAARIANFFDVAAGSGAGGVLAAMLFTRGPDGCPLFSAEEAHSFLTRNHSKICSSGSKKGALHGIFRHRKSGRGVFRRVFGEATLRDTVKPLLVPCYDLATGAPFVFSRADAVEMDGFDFKISDVCVATCANMSSMEMRSVDGRTRITAVGGGLAMANPTAAAITHVLNNKLEFPLTAGVEDLLVLSLGSGEAAPPFAAQLVQIAGESSADMVDQAVAMAFGHNRTKNYLRIQAQRFSSGKIVSDSMDVGKMLKSAEEMLAQRNVESVLFRGKKVCERTNAERLGSFSDELVKEHVRRKTSVVPTVMLKQVMTPRTSSATTATTTTVTSTVTSTSTSP